jgi:hypothetical protein
MTQWQKGTPRGESVYFPRSDPGPWTEKLKALSGLNLPLKSIADAFGCAPSTLASDDVPMRIVRLGWATYRATVERELLSMAMEVPGPNATPEEAASIRASKLKALAQIHKVLHKDPFVPVQEEERVRRLTDEELRAELARALEGAPMPGVRKGAPDV